MEAPAHPRAVLVVWSRRDPEMSLVAREIAAELRAQRPPLTPVDADLHALLGMAAAARSVAAWASRELETSMVASLAGQALEPELRQARPELVLAADPTAAAVAAAWRHKGLLPAPVVAFCAGLAVDPRWAEVDVQRALVLDEAAVAELEPLGVAAEIVAPTGPAAFVAAANEDRAVLRQRFGIAADRPAVLVAAEGLDLEALGELLLQLALLEDRAALLIDTGGDEETARHLRSRAELFDVPAQMFGETPERPALWALCDALVARPLRCNTRRALGARLPLCALPPRDDAEAAEARAFARRGIGVVVERSFALAVELERLLTADHRERAMAALSAIGGGERLGVAAQRLCEQSAALLAEAASRGGRRAAGAEPTAPAPDAEGAVPPAGPLEPIGRARSTASAAPSAEARAAAAEAALRRLEAEEELARLKARAGHAAEDPGNAPAAEPGRASDRASEPARPAQPAGIDPGFKKSVGQREQAVEDALAEIKRRLNKG